MEWYALQVLTGTEADVANDLEQYGCETILPYVPIFLKHDGKLNLIKRPMLPGYVLTKADLLLLYRMQQTARINRRQKKIIRICGNGCSPVPLDDSEISFFRLCQESMRPLLLDNNNRFHLFRIVDAPPWASSVYVKWYDQDRFKAKIVISSGKTIFRERSFNIAAYSLRYDGAFADQLENLYIQSLNTSSHGQFEAGSG